MQQCGTAAGPSCSLQQSAALPAACDAAALLPLLPHAACVLYDSVHTDTQAHAPVVTIDEMPRYVTAPARPYFFSTCLARSRFDMAAAIHWARGWGPRCRRWAAKRQSGDAQPRAPLRRALRRAAALPGLRRARTLATELPACGPATRLRPVAGGLLPPGGDAGLDGDQSGLAWPLSRVQSVSRGSVVRVRWR